jgi:hypothetical protein
MAVEAAARAAAVAAVKTAAEGAAARLAPIALEMMGADNGRGRQQSTKKWQKWQCGSGNGNSSSRDCSNGGSHDRGDGCSRDEVSSGGGNGGADSS